MLFFLQNFATYTNLAAVIAFVVSFVPSYCLGADKVDINREDIIRAWISRQSSVRAFDFLWTGEKNGAIDDLDYTPNEEPPGSIRPPDRASFRVEFRLAIDERGRTLLDYTGKTWNFAKGELIPKRVIDIYDGNARTIFFPDGTGSLRYPNAAIERRRENSTDVLRSHNLALPIALIYRPFNENSWPLDKDKLTLTTEKGIADQNLCLILKYQKGIGMESFIWIDPNKGFLPVRLFEYSSGVLEHSLYITYSTDERDGWLPSSWRDVWSYPNGKLKGQIYSTETAETTKCKINVPIDGSSFEVQFPSGTWVHNYYTEKEYIVRDGGDIRPILPGEYNGTNYEQLLHSNPPRLLRKWLGGLIVIICTISISIFGYRYYRRLLQARR